MPTGLAQEFSAAMTTLLAAAAASDARMWMKVSSEIRALQSRCSEILRLVKQEADVDAATMDAPRLPVLLATGYADLPNGQKSDLPQLSKPYDQVQLQTQINRLLAREHPYSL